MRKMKDSGIAWIEEIPEEWKVGRIGKLYTERKQKVSDADFPPLSVTMKGILPQLSTAAKTDAHEDRKLVRKGDFAINSRSDRRGSCGISPYDGSVSLINIILKPREAMHPVYYEWLFHSTMFSDEFYKWGHGIVDDLWTTNWQDMKKISVPIPPHNEQRRIASYLDEKCAHIDAVIEKTRASIGEYKKLKQAIITRAVTKGLRQGRKMKDSGIEWIGKIPQEWALTPIKNIGSTSSGATPLRAKEKDYFTDANIPWIKTLDLNETEVFDCSEKITQEAVNSSSCSIMPVNTVCVAMYGGAGTIGKCGLLQIEAATNQAVCSIITNDRIFPKFLLYHLIAIRKDWMYYAVGTRKDPNISQDIVARMKIAIPPLPEQQEIAAYLDAKTAAIDRLIAKKEQLIAEMQSCKKSLIYEVVTGKRETAI